MFQTLSYMSKLRSRRPLRLGQRPLPLFLAPTLKLHAANRNLGQSFHSTRYASSSQAEHGAIQPPIRENNEDGSYDHIYVRKDPREHILLRPGMYIGSTQVQKAELWGLGDVSNSLQLLPSDKVLVNREIEYIPGLLKLIDEILVNACDNLARDPKGMTRIEVDIVPSATSSKTGSPTTVAAPLISVLNDGQGIPVVFHTTENVYIPELIFGHLLTGSNFGTSTAGVPASKGDAAKSAEASAESISAMTGGQHGYGAKLTNIFSTEFLVETADSARGLLYKQKWTSNLSVCHPPEIVQLKKGTKDYTKVSFRPDLTYFGGTMGPNTLELMKKRVLDVAGTLPLLASGKRISISFNGEALPIRTWKEYCDRFLPIPSTFRKTDNNSVHGVGEEALTKKRHSTTYDSTSSLSFAADFAKGMSPLTAAERLSRIASTDVGSRLQVSVGLAGLKINAPSKGNRPTKANDLGNSFVSPLESGVDATQGAKTSNPSETTTSKSRTARKASKSTPSTSSTNGTPELALSPEFTAQDLTPYNRPGEVQSFVNSMQTIRGGTHVDVVLASLSHQLAQVLQAELRKIKKALASYPSHPHNTFYQNLQPSTITSHLVRQHLRVWVNLLMPGPAFDSQAKEALVSHEDYVRMSILEGVSTSSSARKDVRSPDLEYPSNFIQEIMTSLELPGAVFGSLLSRHLNESETALRRATRGVDAKLRALPKLEDANWAGTKRAGECTLILTEGDSAKALAVAGLGVVGRDAYGVFPLKGKLVNVRGMSPKTALENTEITALVSILGLDFRKRYGWGGIGLWGDPDASNGLRYGRVAIMSDQDNDGNHIRGLVANFFATYWPELLVPYPTIHMSTTTDSPSAQTPDSSEDPDALPIQSFLYAFRTPLMKARKGAQVREFFSVQEYDQWLKGASAPSHPIAIASDGAYAEEGSEIAKPASRNRSKKGSATASKEKLVPQPQVSIPGEALIGKWSVKYYKGLGTSTAEEGREYFSRLQRHMFPLIWSRNREIGRDSGIASEREIRECAKDGDDLWTDHWMKESPDGLALELFFGKGKSAIEGRKEWLARADVHSVVESDAAEGAMEVRDQISEGSESEKNTVPQEPCDSSPPAWSNAASAMKFQPLAVRERKNPVGNTEQQSVDASSLEHLAPMDLYTFASKDLLAFSLDDLRRSLPSVVDGLKPSQRKILHAAFLRFDTQGGRTLTSLGFKLESQAGPDLVPTGTESDEKLPPPGMKQRHAIPPGFSNGPGFFGSLGSTGMDTADTLCSTEAPHKEAEKVYKASAAPDSPRPAWSLQFLLRQYRETGRIDSVYSSASVKQILQSSSSTSYSTDKEIKVAQFSGYVAEKTNYHHGEASLTGTIVGMAQNFVGSNNIPLLLPSGQFGTRFSGGKDAASARYIFTALSPTTRFLFPSQDDPILMSLEEDGMVVEPKAYLPVIPFLLVNGSIGIGTGWSTNVPPCNPHQLIQAVRFALCSMFLANNHMDASSLKQGAFDKVQGMDVKNALDSQPSTSDADASYFSTSIPLLPWWQGFIGSILPGESGTVITTGVVEILHSDKANKRQGAKALRNRQGGQDASVPSSEGSSSSSSSSSSNSDEDSDDAWSSGDEENSASDTPHNRPVPSETFLLSLSDGFPVVISELPVGRWVEDTKAHLLSLVDSGSLRRLRELHSDRSVRFEATVTKEGYREILALAMELVKKQNAKLRQAAKDALQLDAAPPSGNVSSKQKRQVEGELDSPTEDLFHEAMLQYFKLTTSFSMNNMHAFNAEGHIQKYSDPWEIILDWIPIRFAGYIARKESIHRQLHRNYQRVNMKAKFIQDVSEGSLQIIGRPKEQIVAQMYEEGYIPAPLLDHVSGLRDMHNQFDKIPSGSRFVTPNTFRSATEDGLHSYYERSSKDFDYLLNIPLSQLTQEQLKKAMEEAQNASAQLHLFEGITPIDLWFQDLDKLEANLSL